MCVRERESLLNSSKSSTRHAGGVRDGRWTGAANEDASVSYVISCRGCLRPTCKSAITDIGLIFFMQLWFNIFPFYSVCSVRTLIQFVYADLVCVRVFLREMNQECKGRFTFRVRSASKHVFFILGIHHLIQGTSFAPSWSPPPDLCIEEALRHPACYMLQA